LFLFVSYIKDTIFVLFVSYIKDTIPKMAITKSEKERVEAEPVTNM
jgi:hypothetical protein